MSTTEKNFAEKTFFVSTFLDSYKDGYIVENATMTNEIKMVQEVAEAIDSKTNDAIPAQKMTA